MSDTLIVLLSIGYFLATVSLIAALIFLIVVAVELRRGISALKEFINSTKSKLDPAIFETEKVIQGVRASVDDVNEVTRKVKELSQAVEKLTFLMSEVVNAVERIKSSVSLRSSALKTALSVATNVFLENLKKGGK
ncbi:DUF948 domain-containing protein [Thermodesulfovibrio sp. 3907-1M]|uniref:DUF948 domain-containing protein n=1 Tax=Thermodesulfovibrio autotrophicus TaxID=3118333 RepID=A0AAU8GW01_9BACT